MTRPPDQRAAVSTEIAVPADALVLLVGVAGSGKTTFARRHFPADAVLSSDAIRAQIAGDEADQSVSREAFRLLRDRARERLRQGSLTVVDATNLSARSRRPLRDLAAQYRRPSIAIVLDVDPRVAAARNAHRAERVVRPEVLDEQLIKLDMAIAALPGEGFAAWHLVRDPEQVESVRVREATAR